MSQQVATRYAQALYNQATAQKSIEIIDADVALLGETLQNSAELRSFFKSPIIRADKKKAVVEKLFSAKVGKDALNFVLFLVEKGRESLIAEVLKAYQQLRFTTLGVVEAEARVAFALGKTEEAQLQTSIEKMTGKQVRLSIKIDPAVIGGAVVKIGDKVYDGSVKSNLDALRKKLLAN